MKKYYILILIAVILAYFSFYEIKDYQNYKNARNSYLNKDYKNALEYYKKIDRDEAKFNEAATEYRLGDFNKTINILNDLNSTKLGFKKLHNLGNSYAKTDKIDKGIESYEKALSIKDDNDTRYNLELLKNLKKKKEEQEQNKQENKDENQTKQTSKDQKSKDKINENNEEKKKNEQNKDKKKPMDNMSEKQNQGDDNSKEHDKKDQQNGKKDENDNKDKKEENKTGTKQDKKDVEEKRTTDIKPVDIKEKKWQKFLDNREIGTLMMPFEQKEEDNEKIKPW